MKSRLKIALLSVSLLGVGVLVSCSKDREADWKCACPEGIPSNDPNVGTLGSSTSTYQTVTEDVAKARCKEEGKGRISECVLSKVE